jgi:hypothetical protein
MIYLPAFALLSRFHLAIGFKSDETSRRDFPISTTSDDQANASALVV